MTRYNVQSAALRVFERRLSSAYFCPGKNYHGSRSVPRQIFSVQQQTSALLTSHRAITTAPVTSDPLQYRYFPDRRTTSGLTAVFHPKSVAVVGATDRDGAIGKVIVKNLISGSKAVGGSCKIYPINPTRKTVMGLPCFSSVEAIPGDVDMVVIVTPASTCVDIMKQCAMKGVKSAIVISAGFKEIGASGIELENKMIRIARDAGIRVIGPNCLGVMNPNSGLNATFAATMGLPGNLAFISQSGAMCTTFLDWSLKEKIGFSAFISVGSMADVGWGDLIDYLGNDPNTKAILVYMEAIGDAAAFLGAAKEPIIVIKAGRSEAAAAAAASHTGALAGSHQSFVAAMERVGVLVTDSIRELQDAALLLGKQPRPLGPNLLIVTNAGGPGVLATDAVVASGAKLSKISPATLDRLNAVLPAAWSHSNPVDILGDAPPHLYAKTLEVVLEDENSDGVLIILSPQDVTEPTKTAEAVVRAVEMMKKKHGGEINKPIIAAWMGGDTVAKGFTVLSEAGIPTYANSDDAAMIFGRLWSQVESQEKLYAEDSFGKSSSSDMTSIAPASQSRLISEKVLEQALKEGRYLLTEAESKAVLSAYGIGIVRTVLAYTPEQVEAAGQEINSEFYAVKLNSRTLTHKADVGGVKLNLKKDQLKKAFAEIQESVTAMHGASHFEGVSVQPMLNLNKGIQLILGSSGDAQFGPLMMFGSGGTMVEVYKDTVLAVPPITDAMAEQLMQKTRIYKALKGGQGKRFEGVDLEKLRIVLARFSNMIVELSDLITECDINPLLAMKDEFISLDARFVLKKPDDKPAVITVRPYPVEYVFSMPVQDVGNVTIRPIVPSDKDSFVDFQKKLSPATVESRYLENIPLKYRISKEQLIAICHPDYRRMITLIAERDGEIVAVAELERSPPNHLQREIGQSRIVVRSDLQKKGLGKIMMDTVLKVSKQEGIQQVKCPVPNNNEAAKKLMRNFAWSADQQENSNDNDVVIMGTIKI